MILAGCAGATLVNTNALPLGGTVRYNNGNFVREKSRLKALETMMIYCKEKSYKIVKEEFNPEVVSLNVNGVFYSEKDNYMFIKFLCE